MNLEPLKQVGRRLRRIGPLNTFATTLVRRLLRATGRRPSFSAKHLHRVGRVTSTLPDGTKWTLISRGDDWIPNQLFWHGPIGYEPEALPLFHSYARGARTTLDIGAYIGVYAIVAALANPASRVVAFEPLPEVYARLLENVAVNRLGNVECARFAVGRENGRADLFRAQVDVLPSSSSLSREFMDYYDALSRRPVEVVTLDYFCELRGIVDVDLVKIDTETTEPDVLDGMRAILHRDRPVIFCEVLPGFGAEGRLEALLHPYGYRYFHLTKEGPVRTNRIVAGSSNPNYLFAVEDRPLDPVDGWGAGAAS